MNETLVVGFDVDGILNILNKGTTLETTILLLRKKFNDKLARISGDHSMTKQIKEIATMLLILPLAGEYIKHAIRTMDIEVLKQIADFKEKQGRKSQLNTMLVVASGRPSRLTGLTQNKIRKAGFEDLFDAYYLRPTGYGSPGWKNHVSNTIEPADIFAQIDDDPLAGHAVLKTPIPGRQKIAFIINNGLTVKPWLLKRAAVENPSGLYVVKTISQALAGIANLR